MSIKIELDKKDLKLIQAFLGSDLKENPDIYRECSDGIYLEPRRFIYLATNDTELFKKVLTDLRRRIRLALEQIENEGILANFLYEGEYDSFRKLQELEFNVLLKEFLKVDINTSKRIPITPSKPNNGAAEFCIKGDEFKKLVNDNNKEFRLGNDMHNENMEIVRELRKKGIHLSGACYSSSTGNACIRYFVEGNDNEKDNRTLRR